MAEPQYLTVDNEFITIGCRNCFKTNIGMPLESLGLSLALIQCPDCDNFLFTNDELRAE